MLTLSWSGAAFQDLRSRAAALVVTGNRAVLGIAGAPGTGKSTLATELLAALEADFPGQVALVGMDAFHLAQRVLERHGLAAIKGAPQTFDVEGYLALLRRLRSSDAPVFAPEFRREIENSIAGNVEVGPEVGLVITEGNYLLLPEAPWDQVRPLLDEAWFLQVDDAVRRSQLTARHQRYGHGPQAALARTTGSDESNARLVQAAQNRPDVLVVVDPFQASTEPPFG